MVLYWGNVTFEYEYAHGGMAEGCENGGGELNNETAVV